MPKVKRTRKPPPDGWELIEPTIDELDAKMREGLSDEGPRIRIAHSSIVAVRLITASDHIGPHRTASDDIGPHRTASDLWEHKKCV